MQKSIKKWLGFIIGSLVLLCGCGGGGGGGAVIDLPTPTPYTVNTPTAVPTTPTAVPEKFVGKIIDLVTKEPINEVEIIINGQSLYSDASGNFSVETIAGNEINMSKNGYHPYLFNINHENILLVKLVPVTVSRIMFEAQCKNEYSSDAGTIRYHKDRPPKKYVFFSVMESGEIVDPNLIQLPIDYINGEMKNIADGFFANTSYEIVAKKPSEDGRVTIHTTTSTYGYSPVMSDGYVAVAYTRDDKGNHGWQKPVLDNQGYIYGGGIVMSGKLLPILILATFMHEKGHNDGFCHPNDYISGVNLLLSIMNTAPTEKMIRVYSESDLCNYLWLYARDKGNISPDTNIIPKSVNKLNNLSHFGWLINLDTTKVLPEINTNTI